MMLFATIRIRNAVPLLALLLTCAWCVGQEATSESLGDVARAARKESAESDAKTAKKVYTDDEMAQSGSTDAQSAGAFGIKWDQPANGDTDPQAVPAVQTGTGAGMPRSRRSKAEEDARKKKLKQDQQAEERDPNLPQPLSVSGTLTGGYYRANTRNGHIAQDSSPLGSVRLDISGYYHSPDFLNYDFKPQGSLGRQSSETVFPDGQGFSANSTFLGGSVAPVTFSYTKIDRKISTFGPLEQLAGLDANTSQDALTVDWRIHPIHFPELDLNFSRYNDSFEPLQNIAPRTENRAKLFSATLQDELGAWKLQSRFRVEHSNQDLINIFDPTQAPFLYKRDDNELQANATRDFGTKTGVSIQGGITHANSAIGTTPYDQSFRYITGSTHFQPTEKLTLTFRAGYTDNLVGATLQQAIAQPNQGATPGVSPSPQFLLVPTQAHLMLQSYSTHALYAITKDLRLDGDVSRDTTSTPVATSIVTPDSSLNSIQAGVGYSHHFNRWQFQSHYGVNTGLFDYGTVGTSHSLGHTANTSVTVGSIHSIELTGAVQGTLQNVRGATDVHDQSWDASLTASRQLFRNGKLQATYDRGRNLYNYASTHYESSGQGLGVSLLTPRFELNLTHHIRDGLTFQADPRLQFLTPDQVLALSGAFPGATLVPSTANWSNAAVGFHATEKITARATWMQNRQSLNSTIHNNYTEWEVSAGYVFRSLNFDFGYIHHNQDFGVDFFQRNRMFFRVVREFKVF